MDEMDVQTIDMITAYEVSAEAEMNDDDEQCVFRPQIVCATIKDLLDVVTRFVCDGVYGDRIIVEIVQMPLEKFEALDDWCGLLN
jgi:hypothetical protein